MSKTPKTPILLSEIPLGTFGLGYKLDVLAHEGSMPRLDPYCYVYVYSSDEPEEALLIGEVVVERVEKGWLIDGCLYELVCTGVCHQSSFDSTSIYENAGYL